MIEELRLQAGGLHFRCLAAGPATGVPVLLLHGFPEGAESWSPQLEGLAERGFRAVAPDLRGYGGTDCPSEESAYGIEPLMGDVAALLGALGWRSAHLAGHDWGALIGWPFVSRAPERVRSWTALAVGHPVALAEAVRDDPDQQRRSAYIRLFRERGKAEEVLSEDGFRRLRAMFRMAPDPDAVPPGVVDRFMESVARPGRLTAALNYYRVALPAVAGAMREVTVPTLLIWGPDDPALGRAGVEATAARVSGPYRLEVLEGAGHWLQFEQPARVTDLLAAHCQANEAG